MRREMRDRNILFLCHDIACLSQIAEATARHLGPRKTRIFSAGIRPGAIPPAVVRVMNELGISMSGQTGKGLGDVPLQDIDLVISFGDAHKQARRCRRAPPLKLGRSPQASQRPDRMQPIYPNSVRNETKSTIESLRYF